MTTKQITPTNNNGSSKNGLVIAGLTVLLGGAGIWAATKFLKSGSKISAVFDPVTGLPGTVVAVTGKGWSASEVIQDVLVGDIRAINTLAVDSKGVISGTITMPQLPAGSRSVVIVGTKSVFTGTFLMTSISGALGWLLLSLTPTTLTVASSAAINQTWGASLSDITLAVIHSAAVSLTWGASLSDKTLAVAHQAPLNPAITLTSNTLKPGDALWYTLSGFPPNAQVTMNIGQYSIVVTTDGSGYLASTNFPAVTSLPGGFYTLIAKYGNNQSVTATFNISAAIPLQITSDPNGFVDVIDLSTGQDITQLGTAIIGHSLQITAYAWNSNYQFAGWTDTYGILGPLNKMYPQVTITATSAGINLYANFTAIVVTPPPPPNTITAPGTKGDGQTWVLLRDIADGSYGWDDYQDYIYNPPDPSVVTTIGVYASGTTVNL
jgi:hypothetical protein